ncbi:MAG: TolC family protein [Deltaproteobacteria bacterium]|nr:TolC family protein [Deltaproteobacteria bacterium]
MRSTALALALASTVLAAPAPAEEPPHQPPTAEADLVARYLASPVMRARIAAANARTTAAGIADVDVTNPEIAYRHEDARGTAGARTDAVVGTVTVDLGFVAAGERRAANQRGEAGPLWARAAVVDAVCGLRREAGDSVAADSELAVRRRAQGRLETLGDTLVQLAAAGEASGYDRDRTLLAVAAHRVDLAVAEGEAQALRSTLAARVSQDVESLELSSPSELPAPDQLVETAIESHPELRALLLEQKAARTAEAAARRKVAPDLTLSGGARFDAPPDRGPATPGFEVGAAVELPIFDTHKAEAFRAEASLQEIGATLARRQAEVGAEVRSAWTRLASARRLGGLEADPAAVWDAAQDRFVGGEASIEELLQTARDVEAAQLSELRAQTLRRTAYIDLWCAAGTHPEAPISAAIEEALR